MHLNKVVVIQSPVMVDINNSRSWRVKFYTDTGSSWTTVFPGGGIKLIILHGKKILWDKIGETAVKWISVAKIGEQWTGEHGWNRPLAVILNCAFKVFLEICQNIPQDLRFFKRSLYFQSIYTRETSPKCLGQCMFWLPSLTHQTMIHKINRKHPKMEKPLQEWTLSMGELVR